MFQVHPLRTKPKHTRVSVLHHPQEDAARLGAIMEWQSYLSSRKMVRAFHGPKKEAAGVGKAETLQAGEPFDLIALIHVLEGYSAVRHRQSRVYSSIHPPQ